MSRFQQKATLGSRCEGRSSFRLPGLSAADALARARRPDRARSRTTLRQGALSSRLGATTVAHRSRARGHPASPREQLSSSWRYRRPYFARIVENFTEIFGSPLEYGRRTAHLCRQRPEAPSADRWWSAVEQQPWSRLQTPRRTLSGIDSPISTMIRPVMVRRVLRPNRYGDGLNIRPIVPSGGDPHAIFSFLARPSGQRQHQGY